MGSISSSDKRRPIRGGIQIQIPKTGFISGETIMGVLNVQLEEPYQGHILQVSLDGLEETRYAFYTNGYYYHKGVRRYRRRMKAHGMIKVLDFSIPVYDFAHGQNQLNFTLQPGQWSIPFQIVIANSLPSSLTYYQSDSTNCSLKYRINASIIPTDQSIRPVQGTQDILIAQQIQMIPVVQNQSYEFILNTFCCCGSSKLIMKGSTDKPCYAPGESAVINLESDLTNFSSTLNEIKIQLYGVLVLNSQTTSQEKRIEIDSVTKYIKTSKGKLLNARFEMPIPPGISLTCNGSLVNLQYFLRIKPKVDGTCNFDCCDEGQIFLFPIIINPTSSTLNTIPAPQLFVIEPPQDWNPTLLQPTQFTPEQMANIQQQQGQYNQMQAIHQEPPPDDAQGIQVAKQSPSFIPQNPMIGGPPHDN